MKHYDVTISETLQMTVPVKADSLTEAEEKAENMWNDSKYVLGSDHFKGVEFFAREHVRSKDLER